MPENSLDIAFGFALNGKGQIWVDDVCFEVLGEGAARADSVGNQSKGLPDPSRSFDFEGPFVEGTYGDFPVAAVIEDGEGAVWIAGRRIIRYSPPASSARGIHGVGADGAWRIYTAEDGLIGGGTHLYQTRDGTMWALSTSKDVGVNRYDEGRWTHFSLKDVGGNNSSHSITETGDGAVWIGASSGYLHVHRNGVWTVYKASDVPIPEVRIVSLLEASDGALWIAGRGEEAVRLDYRTGRWKTFKGLKFQCDTPDGVQWFLARDSSVVRYDPSAGVGQWARYGQEDGLMGTPRRLFVTRDGAVWAVGSQDSVAATAHFEGDRWSLKMHPKLSWCINPKAVCEASDGTLWLGGGGDPIRSRGQMAGVLRFDGSAWTHYRPPEVPFYPYGIGEAADGSIWVGGSSLHRFDGQSWEGIQEPVALASGRWSDVVYTASDGDLWVGSRYYGAFQYDGKTWVHHDVRHGVVGGRIQAILQTDDGSVWVATPNGVSRFDGRSWTTQTLPPDLIPEKGGLRQSRDGALWINSAPEDSQTVRYEFDRDSPETTITLSLDEVSQPGNTIVTWAGVDPWCATPDGELRYAWRLDEGEWCPFSGEKNKTFLALSSGNHTFEVKARDRDFNEDPTPAVVHFTVIPPVWEQPWFIGLMVVFVGAIGLQTRRVIRRDQRLQEANTALSAANKELFQANVQIQAQTERKSTFLASMSHELRTPMNAIIGFTRLTLRREKNIAVRTRENLQKVQISADHLLDLINNILDLSKIEAGRMDVVAKPFDVKALIAGCCSEVEPLVKPGVKLDYAVADDIGEVNTDQARIRQIVINLLSNALKFTEQGEVAVRAAREDESVVIAVSDTGSGIPADALDSIFEEFQQVKGSDPQHKGTGLGLPITKGFAELLGGSISVQSEMGKGSTFTVRVPVFYRGPEAG